MRRPLLNEHETELFAALDRRVRRSPELREIGFAGQPSFVPYVLLEEKPETPFQLLEAIGRLRKDSLVIEYRDFRKQLLRDWIDKGLIQERIEQEIKKLAVKLRNRLAVDRTIDVELGVGATVEAKGVGIDASIKTAVAVDRIWGWVMELLPGHRYVKLLTRLQMAQIIRTSTSIDTFGRCGNPRDGSLTANEDLGRACNSVQGATASLALTACVALWNL